MIEEDAQYRPLSSTHMHTHEHVYTHAQTWLLQTARILVMVSTAMTEINLWRKGSCRLHFQVTSTTEGSQGRNLEAETEAEATEDGAEAHWLALPASLHNPGPPAQG